MNAAETIERAKKLLQNPEYQNDTILDLVKLAERQQEQIKIEKRRSDGIEAAYRRHIIEERPKLMREAEAWRMVDEWPKGKKQSLAGRVDDARLKARAHAEGGGE